MQLSEFQEQFKDLMLDSPKALDNPPQTVADFCEVGAIDLPTRLKVYRNNIVGSLTDLMLASFPITDALVGKAFFEGCARSFILAHPPTQGCLSFYGAGFAEFLAGFEPAKGLPYLADIAAYEIALNQSYYAKDDGALSAESLGQVAPDTLGDLKLALRDSVHLLKSEYPIIAIRDFCEGDQDGTLDLDQGGVHLLVIRPQFKTETVILQEDEFEMLKALQSGQALGEAVDNTLKQHPNFDFQAFLQKHIALETFAALQSNG